MNLKARVLQLDGYITQVTEHGGLADQDEDIQIVQVRTDRNNVFVEDAGQAL